MHIHLFRAITKSTEHQHRIPSCLPDLAADHMCDQLNIPVQRLEQVVALQSDWERMTEPVIQSHQSPRPLLVSFVKLDMG